MNAENDTNFRRSGAAFGNQAVETRHSFALDCQVMRQTVDAGL